MSIKKQIYIIVGCLIGLAVFCMYMKHNYYGIPFRQSEKHFVWNIGAKITFNGKGDNVLVSLALPQSQDGKRIIKMDENFIDYGYNVKQTPDGLRGEWTKAKVEGHETIYYNIKVVNDLNYEVSADNIEFDKTDKKDLVEKLTNIDQITKDSALKLYNSVKAKSADPFSFTTELIKSINDKKNYQSLKVLTKHSKLSLRDIICIGLAYEEIYVEKVDAIELVDGIRNKETIPMIEVYYKNGKELFDVKSGKVSQPGNYFLWRTGGTSLIDVTGAKNSKISFSVARHPITEAKYASEKIKDKNTGIYSFSLYTLPASEQNMFKYLLMVPIGALIVVFLRVIIGLRTSGTFMPILIALAFMKTTLILGIVMFVSVVVIGLVIRTYFSHLSLLLVARISAVVIIVIGIMGVFSVLAYKLGFLDVLKITFFPMIILAWTIERMSIIWEEDGGKEVLVQGGGSLIVAVLAYLAMINPWISFIVFNFPESLMIVLAVVILLGRYTGYRVSELIRFKPLVK